MMIEHLKYEDINQASTLIKNVFEEFIAADFNKNGVDAFYKTVGDSSIRERFLNHSLICVAKEGNKITGYIEFINTNHIYLFFVENEFQNRGIAGKLLDFTLSYLKGQNPELKELTVNSTLSAVKIYEKLGFQKMADYQYKNGILSFPMKTVF